MRSQESADRTPDPKPGGKVSLVVTNSKLAGASMVEERRALWRTAVNALARNFTG